MNVLPNSQSRHMIHGAAAAFTTASGAPTAFKFAYGTWTIPTTGLETLGIIDSYSFAPLGDQANLKDSGGSTFAIAIIDPGYQITMSILHAVAVAPPDRGSVISFSVPTTFSPLSEDDSTAVVTGVTVKWEREGWRMIEVTAENRASLGGTAAFGAYITEAGTVGAVVYTGS